VYVGGIANITTNNAFAFDSSAMIWKNGEVFSQTPSISSTYYNQYAGVTSLFIENGNIYSAGFTDKRHGSAYVNNSGLMKPILWKNGSQTLLPQNPFGYPGAISPTITEESVKAMYVLNGSTYAVGEHNAEPVPAFSIPSGTQEPEFWVNGALAAPGGLGLSGANSIFVTPGKIYVAGVGKYPAIWMTNWTIPRINKASYSSRSTSLGAASTATNPFHSVDLNSNGNRAAATGIFVVGQSIYVVGWELKPSGKLVAKLWINGVPTDLSPESEDAIATCVYVLKNNVYVGGISYSGQLPKAIIWKNGAKIDMNGAALGSEIRSIFVKENL
jgi:hypothetical protein